MKIRSLAVLAILLPAAASALTVFKDLSEHAQASWSGANDFLDLAYSGHNRDHRHVYDHTASITKQQGQSAWELAKQPGTEAIYMIKPRKSKDSVYVVTKVPGTHPLASGWDLTTDNPSKDAFLFWRVKKTTPELLGYEVRAVGAAFPHRYSIEQIFARARA
ncbi:hypothetical protein EX895_005099 [Sporisorium graminicola]|uniref:Uncharacterized protein n=1 Tax=Sporisorium graminicola TaxID=280036 RepID=A0A4U7KPK3_9BASI|nr:hypothetical protein EX895_005099 [Sporisorium graminicola]TKY86274.1 hypothetical protein EX895_005099 [Sporisorium graminicola]